MNTDLYRTTPLLYPLLIPLNQLRPLTETPYPPNTFCRLPADCYKLKQTLPTNLQTVSYLLQTSSNPLYLLQTPYERLILHNMADISKQISKG
jgi:hypothetical protein